MANGEKWEDFINIAIACPDELAFETEIIIENKSWICKDRGGKIIKEKNIYWIDMLTDAPQFAFGEVKDAIIDSRNLSDGNIIEDIFPVGYPINPPFEITQFYNFKHLAIDFGVPVDTPIYSTAIGNVVFSGWNYEGYGNLIIIESGNYWIYYGHLSTLYTNVGDKVKHQTLLGLSGSTGNSTGPHLHYEIRLNGQPINPLDTF